MLPSLFLSSTAITRFTNGFYASSNTSQYTLPGMSKNSSGSRVPLLSLSIFWKFLYSFCSSFSV